MNIISFSLLSLFFIISPFYSKTKSNKILYGKAIWIEDGDTFKFKANTGNIFWVRMAGIDAPESSQLYGKQAKAYLHKKIYKKNIFVIIQSIDKYGRSIAWVYLDQEKKQLFPVNLLLVKKGLAWNYIKYNNLDVFKIMESKAKAKKIGIWSLNSPKAPWQYRMMN